MKTVKDIDVKGKRVLLRAGLDLPLDQTKDLLDPSRVVDDTRIKDILLTLLYLVEHDAKIVLAAGWSGRPKGEDPAYSLAPVAKRIEQLLEENNAKKHSVLLAPNCFTDKKPRSVYNNQDEVRSIVRSLQDGQIVVLENVRYDPEANANDQEFAAFIASLADHYVNEAETQNHRPEATIVSVPLKIAEKGGEVVYGFKYVDVLNNIGKLKEKLEDASRGPFVFGLCGKKIETDPGITSKISVTLSLLENMKKGDVIVCGGAVIYTFLLAQHYGKTISQNQDRVHAMVEKYNKKIKDQTSGIKDKKQAAKITEEVQQEKSQQLKTVLNITDEEIKQQIGDSYIRWGQEGEQIVFAHTLVEKAKAKEVKVIVASDHVITNKLPDKSGMLPEGAEIKIQNEKIIPTGWLGVGEGPQTVGEIKNAILNASIYLQSGPYSIEDPRVEEISSTDKALFQSVSECKEKGGITIGAGGDTVARIHAYQAHHAFSTITSAGGATLELIQSGTSKGKEAVEKATSK